MHYGSGTVDRIASGQHKNQHKHNSQSLLYTKNKCKIYYNTIQYNIKICNVHNACLLAESEAWAVTGGT